jgi:hypothetical protein
MDTATLTAGDNDIPRGLGCRFVNRKAETVRRKNRETGTTGFRSATFGFVHAAIAIGKADHPLALNMRQSGRFFKLKACSCWLILPLCSLRHPGRRRQRHGQAWRQGSGIGNS